MGSDKNGALLVLPKHLQYNGVNKNVLLLEEIMKKYAQDFTKGNLLSQIFRFSLPLMFSNLLQVLFNMADIAVVGQFAGTNALGSVGSTSIFVVLFTTALIGIAGGMNIPYYFIYRLIFTRVFHPFKR